LVCFMQGVQGTNRRTRQTRHHGQGPSARSERKPGAASSRPRGCLALMVGSHHLYESSELPPKFLGSFRVVFYGGNLHGFQPSADRVATQTHLSAQLDADLSSAMMLSTQTELAAWVNVLIVGRYLLTSSDRSTRNQEAMLACRVHGQLCIGVAAMIG